MADRGTYFDPNFLVLHNYLNNKPKFLGIGNYNEEGFAFMQEPLPKIADVLRRAREAQPRGHSGESARRDPQRATSHLCDEGRARVPGTEVSLAGRHPVF